MYSVKHCQILSILTATRLIGNQTDQILTRGLFAAGKMESDLCKSAVHIDNIIQHSDLNIIELCLRGNNSILISQLQFPN